MMSYMYVFAPDYATAQRETSAMSHRSGYSDTSDFAPPTPGHHNIFHHCLFYVNMGLIYGERIFSVPGSSSQLTVAGGTYAYAIYWAYHLLAVMCPLFRWQRRPAGPPSLLRDFLHWPPHFTVFSFPSD
jgi:hypothetical protein